jgi:hypothetical protein
MLATTFREQPPTAKTVDRAAAFLQLALQLEPELTKMVGMDVKNTAAGAPDEARSTAYLVLVQALLRIVPDRAVNLTPIARLYVKIAATQKMLFGHQLTSCLGIVAEFRVPITFKDLVTPFTRIGKKKPNLGDLEAFLPHFFAILTKEPPHAEFVPIFLDDILFLKLPGLPSCNADIVAYLRVMLGAYKEKVIAAVDQKLKTYAHANYPMILTFFEEAKVKRPLMILFSAMFEKLSGNPNIDPNDVIARTIERTPVRSLDREFLAGLLGRDDLSNANRARIQGLIEDDRSAEVLPSRYVNDSIEYKQ